MDVLRLSWRMRRTLGWILPKAVLLLCAALLVQWLGASRESGYAAYVARAARAYGVPAALIKAVIDTESGGNPFAVSGAGALGLMQATQDKFRPGQDPFSPQANIDVGTRYLSQMLHRFHGNLKLALAAYNAGPNAVARYGGIPPYPETVAYVRAVLSAYRRLLSGGASAAGR